ncbi:MAG: hypothetical protein ABIJ52_03380 [Pseudomonadota bacterium]|nr:hypothetical protein [Pseudomonadota bacterium]
MANRFIKANNNESMRELQKHPSELSQLLQIALRAKRTNGINSSGLEIGEAMIGDYKSIGLTEQKYRTAKKNLEKWKFITTRTTNRGTIAKLINSDVFDINPEEHNDQANSQLTDRQRTDNGQITTNKNIRSKEVKNEKKTNKEKSEIVFPIWLSKDSFDAFDEMRNKIKAPLTGKAREMLINKLQDFKNQGYDPNEILNESTMNSWKGIFIPKQDQPTQFKNISLSEHNAGVVGRSLQRGGEL